MNRPALSKWTISASISPSAAIGIRTRIGSLKLRPVGAQPAQVPVWVPSMFASKKTLPSHS